VKNVRTLIENEAAREAGESIKPGAQAPGSRNNKYFGSPWNGRQHGSFRLSAASRARSLL